MGFGVPHPIYPHGGRLPVDPVLERPAWSPSRLSPYTLDSNTLRALNFPAQCPPGMWVASLKRWWEEGMNEHQQKITLPAS